MPLTIDLALAAGLSLPATAVVGVVHHVSVSTQIQFSMEVVMTIHMDWKGLIRACLGRLVEPR